MGDTLLRRLSPERDLIVASRPRTNSATSPASATDAWRKARRADAKGAEGPASAAASAAATAAATAAAADDANGNADANADDNVDGGTDDGLDTCGTGDVDEGDVASMVATCATEGVLGHSCLLGGRRVSTL